MGLVVYSVCITVLHVLHSTFVGLDLCIVCSFTIFSSLRHVRQDKFLEVVNPKLSLLKLKHKGVISADVRTSIESANDEDAKYILMEHLQKNATVDTLKVYCDVAIATNGCPRMQELGKKMMDALPPKGWSDLWLFTCVCVCVYCLLVYMCNVFFASTECVCSYSS